MIYSCS